ncbi:hypothetical protein [Cognatilysobacter bugurensis]|uniref:Uncharacterized protein n=1 Tax=Cognatilysobacter bugurensis TaxID=543356 RepID=A0A918T183_9GAMM|nr:hypothetical protein [Lysobacter bugurensis]GHA83678.1 hypothetical protein GCM10007067_22250 [Lysobacter bugurensis]
MSAPPTPCVDTDAAAANSRWMHGVRNELNTAMMAAAAARRLLQNGSDAEALENIRRTEAACQRCAQLLLRSAGPSD